MSTDLERIPTGTAAAPLTDARLFQQEACHRIGNSLHLLSMMLMLEERSIVDLAGAREALANVRTRMQCMARLNRSLSSASADVVRLDDYVAGLCDDLADSFLQAQRGKLIVNADPVHVPAAVAGVLGLVLHELVVNAIKHGLGPSGEGTIDVMCGTNEASNIEMQVANDVHDVQWITSPDRGVGMRIVRGLLSGHHGTLEAQRSGGRIVHIVKLPQS
jgi:two-component sensor histidine kinase